MSSLLRRFFPVGRCTRGRIIGMLVVVSGVTFFADLAAYGQMNFMINLGLSVKALTHPSDYPLWRVAVEAVFGLIVLYMAAGRLHDISRPAWWLAVIVALPYIGEAIGLPAIAFVSLIAWLALIFWSPTVGPNAYGPDPRGWTSREQYDAQQAKLYPQSEGTDQPAAK